MDAEQIKRGVGNFSFLPSVGICVIKNQLLSECNASMVELYGDIVLIDGEEVKRTYRSSPKGFQFMRLAAD